MGAGGGADVNCYGSGKEVIPRFLVRSEIVWILVCCAWEPKAENKIRVSL